LFPGAYYALCVTNRRIMVLNLSGPGGLRSDLPFLLLGSFAFLFGYRIGKAQARKDSDRLRKVPLDELPLHCPGSLVVPLVELLDLDVSGDRLMITTRSQRVVYRFEGLTPVHARQLRDLMYAVQSEREQA
jgi:hypothetical protein